MELRHIDIAKLIVSAADMRGKGRADIANILPSVRARGILVPLIVRAGRSEAETTERSEDNRIGSPDTYEIVAGKLFAPPADNEAAIETQSDTESADSNEPGAEAA